MTHHQLDTDTDTDSANVRPPVTLADFDRQRFVTGSLAGSPDGNRLAFVAKEVNTVEDAWTHALYTVPTDGREPPHRLTRLADARVPKWSPDGSQLAFLSRRETDLERCTGRVGREDRATSPQVWAIDVERGGEPRQLTDRPFGVEAFDWGPAGDRLVVEADDPAPGERARLQAPRDAPIEIDRLHHKHLFADRVDVTSYLFVVDLESAEVRRLDDAYGTGAQDATFGMQPVWSPDGAHVAFFSTRTARPDDTMVRDVYVVHPDGTGLRKITDSNLRAMALRWGPNGDRLAFVGEDPTNRFALNDAYVATVADGTTRVVSRALDRSIGNWFMVEPNLEWVDGTTLLAVMGEDGRSRLVRLHADGSPAERVFDWQGG